MRSTGSSYLFAAAGSGYYVEAFLDEEAAHEVANVRVIVDDQHGIRSAVFTKCGQVLHICRSGLAGLVAEGLSRARQLKPAVITLDVFMVKRLVLTTM